MIRASLPASKTLASVSPRTYLWSQRFWLENFFLTTLLIGGSAVLIVILGAGVHYGGGLNQEATSFLNALFMLLLAGGAVWGGRAAVFTLADIGVNRAIALSVDEAAEGRLRRVRQGTTHEVGELWSLLPDNPTSPVPTMLRLLRQICKEAEARRFESGVLVVQPFQGESASQLAELERAQRFCLRMGILGTFVGLLLALGSLPEALSQTTGSLGEATLGNPDALLKGLQLEQEAFAQLSSKLLSSLGLAFGTSAVGITAAVWVAGLSESVRRRQTLYFKEMENCTLTVLTLASRSLNRDALVAGLEQAGEAMKTLEMQLYDGTRKIQEGLAGVAERVGKQTQTIGDGLQELAGAKDNLERFLRRLADEQSDFLNSLRALYDAASMKRLFEGVEGAVERAGEELEEEVHSEMEDLGRRLTALDEAVTGVRGEIGGTSGELVRQVQNVEGAIQRIESRVTDIARRQAFERSEPARDGSVSKMVVPSGGSGLMLLTGFVGATGGSFASKVLPPSDLGCVVVLLLVGAAVTTIIRKSSR